ncbi:MAG TPA: hypothetical protein VKV15_22945 [Bryobacteraceae bacterium]|nr:hypothetical protein [Bryobacteraceae bacterium]
MNEVQSGYFSHDSSTKQLFSESFDLKPFLFRHQLHTHKLLSVPALGQLAKKMAREEKPRGFFRLSNESRGLEWGSPEFRKALDEAFGEIETSQMRLKLSSIQSESEYAEVLANCSYELSDLTSVDLSRAYRDPKATIFISSPNEITPYHVDEEANFLLQIYGTKIIHIFDGNDRELLEWRELEEYYRCGNIRLREDFQSRGVCFDLEPGIGIHNPVNFPHWVQNGPGVSVSLSLGYTRAKNPVDVLQVNHYLRKVGFAPTPPGKIKSLDGAKRAIARGARSIKKVLRHS